MNSSIQYLAQIAKKESKIIIGLMSGTSLDGLDIALCKLSGSGEKTGIELKAFRTISYGDDFRELLQSIVFKDHVDLQKVCLLNSYIGDYFGELVIQVLNEWEISSADIDCIASHGQTVFHAPVSKHRKSEFQNTTLQIGDGDHIASKTGILTITDFRQKHTAAGGEGAPMAALVDQLLFRDTHEFRLLLNIGGIANFTYLPPIDSKLNIVTSDTGPGNTLINKITQTYLGEPYDEGGQTAKQGDMQHKLLGALKDNDFFKLPFPKSTGPELFSLNYIKQAQKKAGREQLSPKDLLATLTHFTAETIAKSIQSIHKSSSPLSVYVSGGGMHNSFMIELLDELLINVSIKSFEKLGLEPDAKEAVCFAVLANEMLSGEGFYLNSNARKNKINFGKISLPD